MYKTMRAWWTRAGDWRRRQPWQLWRAQLVAVLRLEFKHTLSLRRSGWIYLLAFAPVLAILLHAMADRRFDPLSSDTDALAWVMHLYYVRLAIFFGTLGVFLRLIRGKMVNRSLHYLLLAPVRREVLLLGQFLAGAATVLILFEAATLASFAMMYGHHGMKGLEFVVQGPGARHLGAYLLITALAGLGYGAVFLLLSMLFKNPVPPAMLVMAWEALNPMLPALAQRISVASYLRHLMPVSVEARGFLALLMVTTEPVQPWLAVLGVLGVTLAVIVFSCYRMRSLQIDYSGE